jgi:hypothetical protein
MLGFNADTAARFFVSSVHPIIAAADLGVLNVHARHLVD